jgi:hypothetical protein
MAQRVRSRRKKSARRHLSLSPPPAGELAARVREVGVERFAFVCVDLAKHRSRWMMADFLGQVLVPPTTVEHSAGRLNALVGRIRQVVQEADLQVVWVIVERTGQSHLPVQRAFAAAGFQTRILHTFATKQYRQIADPGNKTDDTNLLAQGSAHHGQCLGCG